MGRKKKTLREEIADGFRQLAFGNVRDAAALLFANEEEILEKLPGYAAQNMTFEFMIAFLMVISLIVITVFLYILTMQKIPNYAVLRAQGIPAAYLIGATIGQAVILMVSGTLGALLLMIVSKAAMPSSVPMLINWPLTGILSLALVVLGVAGSLLPVRMISRIDPLDAMR